MRPGPFDTFGPSEGSRDRKKRERIWITRYEDCSFECVSRKIGSADLRKSSGSTTEVSEGYFVRWPVGRGGAPPTMGTATKGKGRGLAPLKKSGG